VRILTYVYPGWHSIPERDATFYPGFTEWDLVQAARPRFPGHHQPRVPLWGTYDDRDSNAVERRISGCKQHGIDGFVYGFFWCRGKRVFEDALDLGFLGAPSGASYPFAVMWANRMPRRVLPVRRADLDVIEADRLVPSDVDDFIALIRSVATQYFVRDNYIRVDGRCYFSIFDSTFFVRELGFEQVRLAVRLARQMLADAGLPPLHLAAIDPQPDITSALGDLGFDSVTHYVFLPDWKGEFLQDYTERFTRRQREWPDFAAATGLPSYPSVAPGWDATPRAADFGAEKPRKYPWSPVIVNEHPRAFQQALENALGYARANEPDAMKQLVFVASLNEWSEGHYLEPDERFGLGWLEAVRDARAISRDARDEGQR
jgi:Glycosyltransferase WbsX